MSVSSIVTGTRQAARGLSLPGDTSERGAGRKPAAPWFLALAVALGPADAPRPEYAPLVTRARNGDIDGAVGDLLRWRDGDLAAAAAELRPGRSCSLRCVRAVVLLHTEAAFAERHLGLPESERRHLDAARSILERVKDQGDPYFERRWELAIGYSNQAWSDTSRALEIYSQVLARYPKDAEALLALGALREQLAAFPTQRQTMGNPPGLLDRSSTTEWQLDEAFRCYDRALAASPDLPEARLRRGRIEALRGRGEAARSDLLWVLSRPVGPEMRALAELFLGDAEERERRLPDAIVHYRAALDLDPLLQPAQLALSHALHHAGRDADAVDALLTGLSATRDGAHGWYAYHTGALHGYRLAMDRLWKEVAE
jgi:tetratricopeptide (TPR) repeat protein